MHKAQDWEWKRGWPRGHLPALCTFRCPRRSWEHWPPIAASPGVSDSKSHNLSTPLTTTELILFLPPALLSPPAHPPAQHIRRPTPCPPMYISRVLWALVLDLSLPGALTGPSWIIPMGKTWLSNHPAKKNVMRGYCVQGDHLATRWAEFQGRWDRHQRLESAQQNSSPSPWVSLSFPEWLSL